MLLNIDSLNVLFLGNSKPDNENIQQILSDAFHFPVFFDFTAMFPGTLDIRPYHIIIVDYAPEPLKTADILGSAVSLGIPVIYLLDKLDIATTLELIERGAVDCVTRDDSVLLITAIYKALKSSVFSGPNRHKKTAGYKTFFIDEILYNLTDAFYVLDSKLRFTFVNRKAEICFECKRDDLLGRVFWDCFPQLQHIPDGDKHVIAMNTRIPMQWETASPDRQFWADIMAYPTQDGGLAVFIRDISEKKRAENVLRMSGDRQTIMLKLSDSLRILDNPIDIQAAATRVIGEYLGVETAFYCDVVTVDGVDYFSMESIYSATGIHVPLGLHPISSPGVLASENFEGRNIVVHDMESDPRIKEAERASLREQRLGSWASIPFIKNGQFVASFNVHQSSPRNWTADEISLIEETTARVWAEVERARAETALRKSEQHARQLVSELENSDRNKNEFINALSHELRNPLAAITASLSLLDLLDMNPHTKKTREIIERQTGQLCHLVDDLLDLTRISNNKIQLNKELFDVVALTLSAAYDHRTLFEEKGIEFISDTCDAPLYIKADPVRIAQIISNLLHNAYKFTEKGGKVSLSVSSQGSDAVIKLHDTGIGIDASCLNDLFKTFWQAKQIKGGLGMGLSIVKGFVELHGGTVDAKSDGINQGSEFTVRLPLAADPIIQKTVETTVENYRIKPLKILMIDDNSDFAEITCSLLTNYGYEAAAEHTGLSGIQKAREFLPHVILCDIGLPDINGYEVARRISDIKDLGDTRLISLSGYAQTSDSENLKHAGFDLHISKPIDIEELKDKIESII